MANLGNIIKMVYNAGKQGDSVDALADILGTTLRISAKRIVEPTNKPTMSVPIYKQSQSQGFYWENEIRSRVFHLPEASNDCEKYDIPAEKNSLNSNENISIKTTGSSSVDCADIFRFYHYDFTQKNTIIVIRYKQIDDSHKKIQEIIELDYTEEMRNILFSPDAQICSDLKSYDTYVRSIPPGRVDATTKQFYLTQKRSIQDKYNTFIRISPKVDSKSQRRVQCSIPLDSFLKTYPQFILSRTTEPMVRGVAISSIIESGRRKRNSLKSK